LDLQIAAQYCSSLIPLLLKVSKTPLKALLRLSAIETLESFIDMPFHVVYPFKEDILQSLGISIGDDKKAVRAVARRCRNKWFLLGETI
jgi:hypothetical protein